MTPCTIHKKFPENVCKNPNKYLLIGLSHQAMLVSVTKLSLLAEYLLDYHGFQYLLSGKLMADPTEGRFGWYRQLNGGNFFMSVKQLLQAEKKIRCFSLLQEQFQFQLPLCANEMMLLLTMETSQLLVTKNICVNCFVFIVVCMDDITESDAAVCYFVSWYIARSVA